MLKTAQVVITHKLTTGCNFHPAVSEAIKIFSLPLQMSTPSLPLALPSGASCARWKCQLLILHIFFSKLFYKRTFVFSHAENC